MKNYLLIVLLALLVISVLSKNFAKNVAASQNAASQKWEYKVARGTWEEPPGPNPTESFGKLAEDPSHLNGWGAEGWELISVVKEPGSSYFLFYFKRPKK